MNSVDITAIVISIPFLITLLGFFISFEEYKMKRKKDSEVDIEKGKQNEARLVRMEADIVYIRQVVDGTQSKMECLETKLNDLEDRTLVNEQDIKNLKSISFDK